MNDKKHIDRLFQEKFKDFEATPNDAAWDNIHDRLHKDKRKRRVIPIWWRVAGVAALLMLLFTVGSKFLSTDVNSDATNSIVDTEKISSDKTNDALQENSKKSDGLKNQIDINKNNVVNENDLNSKEVSNGVFGEVSNDKSDEDRANKNTIPEVNKNRIVNNDKSDSKDNGSHQRLDKDNIANSSSKENKTNSTKDAVVTVSKNNDNNINQNNFDNEKGKSEINKIIEDSKNDSKSAVTNSTEETEVKNSEDQTKDLKKDKSIEDAIAEANTDDEKEEEKKLNKWNISPNVSPIYFNSLGKGSSLDEQFVENTKNGEVTMSYGLGGSYAINDRLKIRAGINKVNMGYNTNNVIAFRSIDSDNGARSRMVNVSTNDNSENMTYLSTESLNSTITPEIINSKSKGSLNQRFGFIEVPMEMEYALINNKLGVNVIGGFSTLIVDENEIYSVVDGTETRIGEANNINNMSYSANIGLGINYNISQKIKVNVEPTFKYQMKTFTNSSGDFQPYFIGVYTGLSYKF